MAKDEDPEIAAVLAMGFGEASAWSSTAEFLEVAVASDASEENQAPEAYSGGVTCELSTSGGGAALASARGSSTSAVSGDMRYGNGN
jgi:hypothetical protein